MAPQYDVIIIGSGAGGGTLARHLAPSGKKILLLERGDWLKREPENWSAEAVFVDNRYVSKDVWYDKRGKAFQPGVHYFVGGATKIDRKSTRLNSSHVEISYAVFCLKKKKKKKKKKNKEKK